MFHKHALVTVTLLSAVGLSVGCRDSDKGVSRERSPMTDSNGMGGMSGSPTMMARSDADLVSMLLEHHEGAIRLSDLEMRRGQNADVKAMAEKIRKMQSTERQDLMRLQQQVGRGMAMGPEMKQKQARAEQELTAAQGHGADHLFLRHMIQHHQDGIVMLQSSLPNLRNQELRQMAQKMVNDQQADIQQMKSMMH